MMPLLPSSILLPMAPSAPPPFLAVQSDRPITPDQQERLTLAALCHDCDTIPKIAGAGTVDRTSSPPVQIMHNGVRVAADCYCGPWMTRIIESLAGHHEPQEEKAFHLVLEALGNARSMVELGAYWSYYSLWFHHRFPGADLLLVEPDPNFLEIGQYNLALNGAAGTFIQAAVDAKPGMEAAFPCESDGQRRPVPLVSVDSLLEDRGPVDLLLADIQGAELSMLEGMKKSLAAGKVRVVFISTHHHSISGDHLTHEKCLDWLRQQGACILAEHTVEESFSGDGLIVASFDPNVRPVIHLSYCRARDSVFGLPNHQLAALEKGAGPAPAVSPAVSRPAGSDSRFISYAQHAEDVLLWRALREVPAGFYVDVGAFHPTTDSVTRAFYERGWRGINVEPVPANMAAFTAARPRDINLQVAVSRENGSRTFHEIVGSGLSGFDGSGVEDLKKAGWEVREHTVETMTLASICREYVTGEVHFLKIDAEQHEQEVLESADFKTFRPWIILVESVAPLSTDHTHTAWEPLLLGAGYEFLFFDGLNRYYASSERVAAMRPHLNRPANPIDDFLPFREVELQAALNRVKPDQHFRTKAETKISQLARSLAESSAKIKSLENKLRYHAANPVRALKLWWKHLTGKTRR